MLSFDTNIAVHAANTSSPSHAPARAFIESLATRRDVAVCELVLVELYLKLRNEKIFPRPLTAPQAAAVCLAYRNNQAWSLIESAPVMAEVWPETARPGFAFRRIIDLSNVDNSVATNAPGQSAQPGSEYYGNNRERLANGQYFPLPYTRGAVDKAATHTLTLTP